MASPPAPPPPPTDCTSMPVEPSPKVVMPLKLVPAAIVSSDTAPVLASTLLAEVVIVSRVVVPVERKFTP